MESININNKTYNILRLLGKGKGGYSYLVTDGQAQYVCKQIHHEPCDYYTFGDKLASELRDYEKLRAIGIPLPRLIEVDHSQERILKEYIRGETINALVLKDQMKPEYLEQMRAMCRKLYAADTNIDYYPTNFVVQEDILYYIDFECNQYSDTWNFENWGIQYWSKTPKFLEAFCK